MSGVATRVVLASSEVCRVEVEGAVIHVHAGALSLRLDRATCESLTTTLAVAMVRLARASWRPTPALALVGEEPCAGG